MAAGKVTAVGSVAGRGCRFLLFANDWSMDPCTPNDLVVGGELNVHLFLISALDGDDFQLHTPATHSSLYPLARRVKLSLLEPADVKRGIHPCRPPQPNYEYVEASFLFSFLRGGDTESTWYVGQKLAYCTGLGWLAWSCRWNDNWQEKPKC
jgi:hypothetical protein